MHDTFARYLSCLNDFPIPFIISERTTGLVIEANPLYLDFFGFRREEIVGKRSTDLNLWVDPDQRARFAAAFSRTDTVSDFEGRFRRKSGEIVTLIVSSRRFVSGGTEYLLSTFTDVSERYRLEQELRASESRYRSIFENRHTVMLIIDPSDGSILDANPAACRFYGYDHKTLTGMNISGINTLSPDEIAAEMARARGEQRNHFHFPHRLASGEIREVEVYSGPITIEGKELLYSIITDITEKRQAEEELRRARDAAEEASRIKSRFLATVSHEIRTPLNAIIGFTSLALDDPRASVCHDYFLQIRTASTTLLTIVNDILDFARLESGTVTLRESTFSPRQLLSEVAHTAQGWLAGRGISLVVEADEGLPELVSGDENRLRQILLNLLNNAVKFTDQGTITIAALRTGEGEGSVTISFEVRDNGIGIPPEKIGTLFTPFVQLNGSATRQRGGTGLGLSICRTLCDLMGGTISIDSTPGEGTVCTVTLPFRPVSRPELPDDRSGSQQGGDQHCSLNGKQILVAEDNPVNQVLMRESLRRLGAEVVIVSDGQQALRCVTEDPGRFDLVLMDIEMPVLDGVEATRSIRRDHRCAHLPIIALTAHAFDEQYRQCIEAGMNGCITKPLDISRLSSLLAPYLPHRHDRSTPDAADPLPPIHGIDCRDLLRRFDRDPSICLIVLKSFVENKSRFAEMMRDLIASNDLERCALEAHSMKGVTANLSATVLNRLARSIEELVQRRDLSAIYPLLDEFDREFSLLAADVSRIPDLPVNTGGEERIDPS